MFATKPRLAADMLADAPDAGVPAWWVTGDGVYGQAPRRRAMPEERGFLVRSAALWHGSGRLGEAR